MGKNDKTGKNVKFYLDPAGEYTLSDAMQKDGFTARGPYLLFLLSNRDAMRRAQDIVMAFGKYAEAELVLRSLVGVKKD
jgi:hypothetical protein